MHALAPTPVNAVQVAAFLKRHLRYMRDWPRAQLVPWVAWFLQQDRALVLTDEANRICGVALGRFVRTIEDAKGPTLRDWPEGNVAWVDALATRHRAALPQLVALLPHKYGPRTLVAGECFFRAGELRMFPMKTLNRFFGGISHG